MQLSPHSRQAEHLDHLKVGDLELLRILIDQGCHDRIQGMAVQDCTSAPQFIRLHRALFQLQGPL